MFVSDQFLVEWIINSLFPSLIEDVTKSRVVTEEKVISRAQYLDIICTQSDMIYDKIPNAP